MLNNAKILQNRKNTSFSASCSCNTDVFNTFFLSLCHIITSKTIYTNYLYIIYILLFCIGYRLVFFWWTSGAAKTFASIRSYAEQECFSSSDFMLHNTMELFQIARRKPSFLIVIYDDYTQ